MRENLYGRVVKSMKQYVEIFFEQGRILDTGTNKDFSIAGMKQMLNVYLV